MTFFFWLPRIIAQVSSWIPPLDVFEINPKYLNIYGCWTMFIPLSHSQYLSILLPLLFLCYCNHFGFYSYRHWIFISTYDRWYIYIYIYIIHILLHHTGIEYLSLLIPIYDIIHIWYIWYINIYHIYIYDRYYIHLYGDSDIWYTHIYTIHIDVYLSPLSLYTIHPFPLGGRWRPELLPRPQLAACCIENGTGGAGGAGGHGVRWTEGAAESLGTCGDKVWMWMWNDSGWWSYVDVIVCGMFGLENY